MTAPRIQCFSWGLSWIPDTLRRSAANGSDLRSRFAHQLVKRFGGRLVVKISSEDKVSQLKAVGADDVINYRTTPDWHIAVRELTKGRGVDQVVDVGGGTLEQSIQAVGLEGQVNFIGRLSDQSTTINLNILYNAVATLRVVFAGNRAQFIAMNRAIAINHMKPIIDRVFPFDDVAGAFRYYEKARAFGKVVISQAQET